ncbi:endonuclease/exonuclease/phosphatase family protein [Jonesiaceae bacterium BS-20]|uniref:Endonuclease/exonuclease/phosphatase family protein n=1 Tax=Jonesiaceae bacterium BS-20 TaxID=3120821 RepID=A0AAU7DY75_9MICO
MTAPASKFTSKYLALLVLVTALAAELIRFSGPLLDSAIERNGVIVAGTIALGTYLAPGLFALTLSARRQVSGSMVMIAVVALGVARLLLVLLDGTVLFGVGLATVALAIATLTIVAGAVSQEGPRTVGTGIGLGLMLSGALNLSLKTLDPIWQSSTVASVSSAVLVVATIILGSAVRESEPQPHVRGLWAIGPVLSLGVVIFANPAFIASQSHLPLWVSAGVLLGVSLALPHVLNRAYEHKLVHAIVVVLAVATIFFVPSWPATPGPLVSIAISVFVALLGLSSLALLTVMVSRTPDRNSSGPLALAATGAGASVILPILLFQLDYDIPLGFPNALLFVATAAFLGGAALRVGAHSPYESGPNAVAPKTVPLVIATISALGVIGAIQTSGLTAQAPAGHVAGDSARVLNWNLHYGTSTSPAVELQAIAELIRQEQATVVTLQEVSRGWILGGGVDMATYLANELGMEFAFVGAADQQFGNALLWHPDTPITDIERIALTYGDGPQRRSAIGGTLNLAQGEFWVSTAHLQHRAENTPTRILQLDDMFADMPSGGPALITGDFNAEPGWPEIAYLTEHGFISGQDTAGDPSQLTWPASDPNIRIDWMSAKDLKFSEFEVLPSQISDHTPQVATVSLN